MQDACQMILVAQWIECPTGVWDYHEVIECFKIHNFHKISRILSVAKYAHFKNAKMNVSQKFHVIS